MGIHHSGESLILSARKEMPYPMKRSKTVRILACLLIALMLAAVLPRPAQAASVSAVTTKSLQLYKSASSSSECYGTIPKGKAVTCTKTTGDWAYITVGKYKGYVLKSGLRAKDTSSSGSSSSSSSSSSSGEGKVCYTSKSTKLYKSASTSASSYCTLASGAKIMVKQAKGDWCYVTAANGRSGYVQTSAVTKSKEKKITEIVEADWFESNIQRVFYVGATVTVTDVSTRKTFKVYRHGGHNHADCEPATASDTATILSIYGDYSWHRRAIWVTVNGVTYAASMNFQPHGNYDIQDNDFDGHFCIHFTNSRTHGTDKVDEDHQNAIRTALRARP